jgi:hypothetical protein
VLNSLLLKFLKFRLKQIWRLFKEVGLLRALLLLTILVSFVFFELTDLISGYNLIAVLFYPLVILPFHFSRKDHGFLKKLALPQEAFFAAEYNILVLPYSLLLVYYQQWELILSGHILTTIIIFIPSLIIEKKSNVNNQFNKLIPEYLFEWRSYIRQHKFLLFFCFSLTALLSFYPYAMLIAILIAVANFSEVFNYLESKELIETYPQNSNFLWSKLKDHSLFVHLLFLPLYSLFLSLHYEIWYLLVFILLIIELSVCFCLFYKYSRFGVSRSVIHNQMPFAIFFISTLVFFPIGIFFVYLYWKKALKALPAYVRN